LKLLSGVLLVLRLRMLLLLLELQLLLRYLIVLFIVVER
jgi:hypothetical protein